MSVKGFRFPVLCLIALLTSLSGTAQQKSNVGLPPRYNKWIGEDVRWIITPQERGEFLELSTDKQRDSYVIEFWKRRNPNPDSKNNAFKEEHYRRLAFSNEHFATKIPGWKTDRGHVFIVYGPPDSIVKHSSIGMNPAEELWNYRLIPGGGADLSFQFVDRCACGEYMLVGNLPNDN